MKLKLRRIAKKDTYTIGKLSINGNYFCDTLEDKDRGLTDKMSIEIINRIKIKDKTAIPTGNYNVDITYSPRFRRNLPLIDSVKGFVGIRIHPSGNTSEDTSGCILVGQNKVIGKVINSRVAFDKLYSVLTGAKNKGEKITLTIE